MLGANSNERRQLPLLALFGHGAMSDLSPLSGVKRKLDFGAVRAAFDPEADMQPSRTFRNDDGAISRSLRGLHSLGECESRALRPEAPLLPPAGAHLPLRS